MATVVSTGVYAVRRRTMTGDEIFEPFSYHYFNAQGDEVGMQHTAFPEHCMLFSPPRKWSDELKRTLVHYKGAIHG